MEAAAAKPDIQDRPQAQDRYFNRELSWLPFNQRVLAEACNPHYPLLERLRFLSISGNNLDEFLMIRVAGLVAQVRSGVANLSIDGKTPSQQLGAITAEVRELEDGQQQVLSDLMPLLSEQRIHIAAYKRLDADPDAWLRAYFLNHVVPVITPQAIDPAHPFPFVANRGIGALFSLTRIEDSSRLVEMVLIPSALPRFVRIPAEEPIYIAIERVVTRYAKPLFRGFQVERST